MYMTNHTIDVQVEAVSTANTPTRAFVILLAAQMAVGAAAIFARFALQGTGPIAVSALRLLIASVPLSIYSYLRQPKIKITKQHQLILIGAGLALAGHF